MTTQTEQQSKQDYANSLVTSPLARQAASMQGEENYDMHAAVRKIAARKAKGTTRGGAMLNENKLITGVMNDYRIHFAATYGRSDNLPNEVYNRIRAAVALFQVEQMRLINVGNVQSVRRSFRHNFNDLNFVEQVTMTGVNSLTLAEQKFGATTAIGQVERRLRDLQALKSPDYDRERTLNVQLQKLNMTRQFIADQIAKQEKLQSEIDASILADIHTEQVARDHKDSSTHTGAQ